MNTTKCQNIINGVENSWRDDRNSRISYAPAVVWFQLKNILYENINARSFIMLNVHKISLNL